MEESFKKGAHLSLFLISEVSRRSSGLKRNSMLIILTVVWEGPNGAADKHLECLTVVWEGPIAAAYEHLECQETLIFSILH